MTPGLSKGALPAIALLVIVVSAASAIVWPYPHLDSAPAAFTDSLAGQSPASKAINEISDRLTLDPASKKIIGPFSDMAGRVADSLYNAVLPGLNSSLHWAYLGLTVILAVWFFVSRKGRGAKGADGRERPCGIIEYILPRGIYTHPSARVDIGLYLIDRAIMPFWILAFLGALAPYLERVTISAMQWTFGPSPHLAVTAPWKLAYGLVTLLAVDACFFFYHFMMHKTRIGWAIHKVHHSAEVLTPLTRFREHFLEAPIDAGFSAIGLGITGGVFAYLFNGPMTQVTLMSVGIFYFLYTINGNFRHYHVSFRYPRWLEYWLQSPGMHHTHHSILRAHWDTNLGLVTSIWDRLFGTLYIAAPNEETPWGLPPTEQAGYRTLLQNLRGPFIEIYAILRHRRFRKQAAGSAVGG
jgi:sterol desaturase/sphingolipid hydroxylase (fatty acid hydroxylase superfamily)